MPAALPPSVPPPSSPPQFPQGSGPVQRKGSFVGPLAPTPTTKNIADAAKGIVRDPQQLSPIQEVDKEEEAPVVRMYMRGEEGSKAPTEIHEIVHRAPPLSSESRQEGGIRSKYPSSPIQHNLVVAEEEERALKAPLQPGKLPPKVPTKEVLKEVVNVKYEFAEATPVTQQQAPVTQPQAPPVKKGLWNWIKSLFSFKSTPKQQTPTPQAAPSTSKPLPTMPSTSKIETEQEKQASIRLASIRAIMSNGTNEDKAVLYNILSQNKTADGKSSEADQYQWSPAVKKLAEGYKEQDLVWTHSQTIEELMEKAGLA